MQLNPPRIKFWPNKENRTVELEIVAADGNVTVSVEMDLEQAAEVQDDLTDARTIVETDWIVR